MVQVLCGFTYYKYSLADDQRVVDCCWKWSHTWSRCFALKFSSQPSCVPAQLSGRHTNNLPLRQLPPSLQIFANFHDLSLLFVVWKVFCLIFFTVVFEKYFGWSTQFVFCWLCLKAILGRKYGLHWWRSLWNGVEDGICWLFGMHPKIHGVYPKFIPKRGVAQFCPILGNKYGLHWWRSLLNGDEEGIWLFEMHPKIYGVYPKCIPKEV